jgi:hypothetical protein
MHTGILLQTISYRYRVPVRHIGNYRYFKSRPVYLILLISLQLVPGLLQLCL